MTVVELSTEDWRRLISAATSGPALGAVAALAEEDARITQALAATQPPNPPPPPPPPPPSPAVVLRLSVDEAGVEVVSVPTGAHTLHWAVMADANATGVVFPGNSPLPLTMPYRSPVAGKPVIACSALDGAGIEIVGSWSNRVATSAVTPPPPPPPPEPPPSGFRVGLDAGGWSWQAAIADFANATRFVRSDANNYSTDAQMNMLAAAGVTLMPLFNAGIGAIGSVNAATYASALVAWMRKYGKGGSYWQGKAADLGATTVEVINEPGNPYLHSDGEGSYNAYAPIIKAVVAATATLPFPPDVLVSFDGGFKGDEYGEHLLSAGAFADPRVHPTVHPYGGHGSASAQGNRERVTRAFADTKRPVYVTEVGWPTAVGQPPTGDSLQWTEDQQVANMRSFIDWAKAGGEVAAVIYFNYADYGSNNWYGIVDSTGHRHKKSFAALASYR